ILFFFSSRRRHTRSDRDWSSDVCSSDLSNSTAMIAQDFTIDHALAAKALRIPRGQFGAGSSPYLAVLDWLKRWPDTGSRRSLLLISSGIDYFRGAWGPFYPDVDTVVSRAQRENVNLWSIYSPGLGHRSRSFALSNLGQNNLSKMTDERSEERRVGKEYRALRSAGPYKKKT